MIDDTAERAGVQPGNVAGNTYDKYATTNPIERRMMTGFFDAFEQAVDGLHPSVVVEVGAGEGRVTAWLRERFPDAAVIGLDLPDARLAQEWAATDEPMFFGDATRLPFADGAIDLLVALEVLEHVPAPIRALHEIARVTGGTAVVSVPREPIWRIGNVARGRYLGQLGNTPGHVNHWSARRFRTFVRRRFEVDGTWRPLPWTMVRGRPRRVEG
ncbi:MAG TPA: class I SAM-dependent methyltransferase [Ilumatobacteraceae bacterium]